MKYHIVDKRITRNLILAFYSLFLLLHISIAFAGFYNNDDVNYMRKAAAIASGHGENHLTEDHFQLRWSIIYLTAFFYKLFGISHFTSSLASYFAFIGTGVLLKRSMRSFDLGSYFFALTFFFLSHSVIFYTHRTLPDPLITLVALGLYFVYSEIEMSGNNEKNSAIYFSLLLLVAIITKETFIIIIPAFIFFLLRDIRLGKNLKFWLLAAVYSLCLIGLYLLYFKAFRGDLFYRYHLLLDASYFSICSFDQLPFIETIKRVSYLLWEAMLRNGDMIVYLPALVALFYSCSIRKKTGLDNKVLFAFVILLLSANFMTISFTEYTPLCHDPRHFLFLMPFASLMSGLSIKMYIDKPEKYLLLPISMLIASLVMFLIGAGGTKFIYLLLSVILSLYWIYTRFSPINRTIKLVFIVLLVGCLFINYLIDILKPPYPEYQLQKSLFKEQLQFSTGDRVIFSSDLETKEMSEYLTDFDSSSVTVRLLGVDEAKFKSGDFILLNTEKTSENIRQTVVSELKLRNLQLDTIHNKQMFELYRVIEF